MKTCLLCGKPTDGSVGAAGIRWTRICQRCKNIEDHALVVQLATVKAVIDAVFAPRQEVSND